MSLTRDQRGSTVVLALITVTALAIMPSLSAEDSPKPESRAKETRDGNTSGAVFAEQSHPVNTAKMNVAVSSKAVLLGTNRDGKVVVGIIVKNKSPNPIWLPRMFEAVNVTVHGEGTSDHLHMDGWACRFPDNYFKFEPDRHYVYEIALPWNTLRPLTHELEIWAPARQKLDKDPEDVIVERITAELDPQTLLAIFKNTGDNKPSR